MTRRPWAAEIDRVNAEARQPVLFLGDHQMEPNGWAAWIETFTHAGYAALTLPLPGEPGLEVDAITPRVVSNGILYVAEALQAFNSRPAVIGHAFGGLIAQVLAGEGLPAAAVAIAPPATPSGMGTPRGEPLLVIIARGDAFRARPPAEPGLAWEVVALSVEGQDLTHAPRWRDLAETALTFVQRFV